MPLNIDHYRELHATELSSATDVVTPRVTTSQFRFAGISGQARQYEHVDQAA